MSVVEGAALPPAAPLLAAVREQGWATTPLLGPDQIAVLVEGYDLLADEEGFGCRPSTISPDPAFRRAARDLVGSVLEPAVRRILPDYRCIVAAYVPKEVGESSAMPMHQDWSTCDEDRWLPLEVWVPLTAAGADDGTLVVVPGSHRHGPAQRGGGSPLVDPAGAGDEAVIEIAPGEALLFHPAIHHRSGPNRGGDLRLAVVSTFQPATAPVLHYRLSEDGTADVYEVRSDYYLATSPIDEPVDGRWVARVPVAPAPQFQ